MTSADSKKKKSGLASGYLHGFSRSEQDRLYWQARFLEPYVHSNIEFLGTLSGPSRILEVGSGVGAQTEILLRRHPQIVIDSVDASHAQVLRARKHLATSVKAKRVRIHEADALHLPFAENSFDGAFLCWFLEHVAAPVDILREVRRCLKERATIHCTEVMNSAFFVHPYSPATLQYWFEFNDSQWSMKGDPFIGAKLGNDLQTAGFQNIKTEIVTHHYDNRTPKLRAMFIEDMTGVLLSAAPGLVAAKKVTRKLVEQMKSELKQLKHDPNAVFVNAWVYASAQAF
ncbi:MAG: methyltransferase domain-containing protein [Cryobacterium sp.]|nr:methyltransferase domain-containing protein [Oligoflexia bacterium]